MQETGCMTMVRYRLQGSSVTTDRDVVMGVVIKMGADGKNFSAAKSMEHKDYPEKENVIRYYSYEVNETFDSVEDGLPCYNLIGVSEYDTRGFIPSSMINMAAANNMYKTFKTLI